MEEEPEKTTECCSSCSCDSESRGWRGRRQLVLAGGATLAAGFVSHAIVEDSLMRPLLADGFSEFPLISAVFYLAAIAISGRHVLPRALKAALGLKADMNLLMTIAVIGALIIGQLFEAASVTFLFALALTLERWSIARAHHAVEALMKLTPDTAEVVRDGSVSVVPVDEIGVGSILRLKPGGRIPLDGTIREGATSVNQAPITGEANLVPKEPGDEVFAGTINNEGSVSIEVTRASQETTLARIVKLIEESQARRAPVEQWVERFARYYTPVVLGLALAVMVLPPLLTGAAWSQWFYQGLVLLVISCPCALVISTPVTVVAGLTSAARSGVLIKGGFYLEAPSRLKAVALDKTGTLTRGWPEVQTIVPLNGHTPAELLATAAGMEAMSEHPLAEAIRRRAARDGVSERKARNFRSVRGKGAEAEIDGKRYWIGSHRFLHELGMETETVHRRAGELEDAGHSVVIVGNDRHICGLISVADDVRYEAHAVVRELKRAGVDKVVMLTGDNNGTARAVARSTLVDEYQAELLPEDKLRAVEKLVEEYGHVAMIGDGVNDAPAMAASTLGIAMGAVGSDTAIETADVALMSDDLSRIPWLIRYSKRAMRILKQNIVFALGTKLLFVGLAVAGLATLWMAIAADMGASLLVIFNGLRLLSTSER